MAPVVTILIPILIYALTQLDTKTNDVGGQTGGILSDPPKPNITQENGFKLGFKFGF